MGLTFSTRRRRVLRPRTFVIALVVAALAVGGYLVVANRDSGSSDLPTGPVDSFLRAWQQGDTETMASLIHTPPPDLAATATSLVKSAPGSTATYKRTSLVRSKNGATAGYHAHVDVAGYGPFDWDGTLLLGRFTVAKNTVWQLNWSPSSLYPQLGAGQKLSFTRSWPTRGSITASDGSVLAGIQSQITIGLEPDRVTTTLPQIKTLLQRLIGTDPAAIDAALNAPGIKPNFFVPIATVPDDTRYQTVLRPQLAPITGVFFQRSSGQRATSTLLGSQLVGSVGPITAELLKHLGPPYRATDVVGLSGLQNAFEKRLAGTPTGEIDIVSAAGQRVRAVKRFPGTPGKDVTVTIDPHVQQAAEGALAGVTQNAALVALDVTTGQIRALVSKPDNGFARAIDGAYPPGSTFKVVTSTALLNAGRSGTTPAPCPPTITFDGRTFRNFEGEAAGSIDLAQAFKISCNNAFIGLADQLPANALPNAAALFGFNVKWSLPVPSVGGSLPAFTDDAERAASAIGQGRVLASPLQMASVAAAVGAGTWHAPSLTTQPAVKPITAAALDPNVLATLRAFMASVAQPGGTADGAGLPTGVFAKTGTAEFGNGNPPQTHAWFIGYRGSIAFAVIVEGGGVGGRVAAPLAAKFLNALG